MTMNIAIHYGDYIIVGRCGRCGGIVSTPRIWMGTQRPPKTCESCDAVVNEASGLPVLPMQGD